MAKGSYAVVGGATRKIKKQYAVINGETRKIKKQYAVVDGTTRLCWSGGGDKLFFAYNSGSDITICSFQDSKIGEMVKNDTGFNNSTILPFASYCVDGKYYVFVGESYDVTGVYYSTDLQNWTYSSIGIFTEEPGTGNGWQMNTVIKYLNGRFIAFNHVRYSSSGYEYLYCYESLDGIEWAKKSVLDSRYLSGGYASLNCLKGKWITYGNVYGESSKKYYLRYNQSNVSCYAYSDDLLTWTKASGLTYSDSYGIVCDEKGDIYELYRSSYQERVRLVNKTTNTSYEKFSTYVNQSSHSYYFTILPYDSDYFAVIFTDVNGDYNADYGGMPVTSVHKVYKKGNYDYDTVLKESLGYNTSIVHDSRYQIDLLSTEVNGTYYITKKLYAPTYSEGTHTLSYSTDLQNWTDVGEYSNRTPIRYEENQ